MVNVLIIGFGRMGKIHARHLDELGVAWKWQDPHVPDSCAYDLARFSHIIIATPILTHYKCYKALQSFKGRILIEKPVVVQRTHMDVFDNENLFAGCSERYNPVIRKLKERLAPGDVLAMMFQRTSDRPGENLYLDIAIHDLDLAVHLLEMTTLPEVLSFSCVGPSYKASLRWNQVALDFEWRWTQERTRSLVIRTSEGTYAADLLTHQLAFNGHVILVERCFPIKEELKDFLFGRPMSCRLSHELLLAVLE